MKLNLRILLLLAALYSPQSSFGMLDTNTLTTEQQIAYEKNRNQCLFADDDHYGNYLAIVFSYTLPDNWNRENIIETLNKYRSVHRIWNAVITNKRYRNLIFRHALSHNLLRRPSWPLRIKPFIHIQNQSGNKSFFISPDHLNNKQALITADNISFEDDEQRSSSITVNDTELNQAEKQLKKLLRKASASVILIEPEQLKNSLDQLHVNYINTLEDNNATLLDNAITRFNPLTRNKDELFEAIQNIILLTNKGAHYFKCGNTSKKLAFYTSIKEKIEYYLLKMHGKNNQLPDEQQQRCDEIQNEIEVIRSIKEEEEHNGIFNYSQPKIINRLIAVQNEYKAFISNKIYQSVFASDIKTFKKLHAKFKESINFNTIINDDKSLADVAIENMANEETEQAAFKILVFLLHEKVKFIKENHYTEQKTILFTALLAGIELKVPDHDIGTLFELKSMIEGDDQSLQMHNTIFQRLNALYRAYHQAGKTPQASQPTKKPQQTVAEKKAELTQIMNKLQTDLRCQNEDSAIQLAMLFSKITDQATMGDLIAIHADLNNLINKAESGLDPRDPRNPDEPQSSNEQSEQKNKELTHKKTRLKTAVANIAAKTNLVCKYTDEIFGFESQIDHAQTLDELAKIKNRIEAIAMQDQELNSLINHSQDILPSFIIPLVPPLASEEMPFDAKIIDEAEEVARRKPLLMKSIVEISQDAFFFADLGDGEIAQQWIAALDAATTLAAVKQVQKQIAKFVRTHQNIQFDIDKFIMEHKLY